MSQIPPLVTDGPPRSFTPLSNHLIFPGQTLYITVVGSSMLGHLRVFSLPNVRVWVLPRRTGLHTPPYWGGELLPEGVGEAPGRPDSDPQL